MRVRTSGVAAVAALALLAGCDGAPEKTNETSTAANASNAVNEAMPPDQMPAPVPSAEAGDPAAATASAPTPAGDGMTIDDTAQGAAAVIRHYYADLDRGDFRAAYGRWGNDGQDSHQSFADFKRGFAETATTSVEVGTPGDSEGGAGSIYIDVPVTVHARLKDGTGQRFTGHYSLRRVNDVDGSTQAQRRWHIYSAALKRGD
jgi:outer membrane murein-binding lipoprotein Lpp